MCDGDAFSQGRRRDDTRAPVEHFKAETCSFLELFKESRKPHLIDVLVAIGRSAPDFEVCTAQQLQPIPVERKTRHLST